MNMTLIPPHAFDAALIFAGEFGSPDEVESAGGGDVDLTWKVDGTPWVFSVAVYSGAAFCTFFYEEDHKEISEHMETDEELMSAISAVKLECERLRRIYA